MNTDREIRSILIIIAACATIYATTCQLLHDPSNWAILTAILALGGVFWNDETQRGA